jgi:Cu+-exporting ATPase
MALESVAPIQPVSKTEYVCPMHPQIIRSEPGNCPICGMTLEPRVVSASEEVSPELADMTRRFWISTALTLPLILIEMSDMIRDQPLQRVMPAAFRTWIELAFASPAVLWAGWPLFVRAWQSIVFRNDGQLPHTNLS